MRRREFAAGLAATLLVPKRGVAVGLGFAWTKVPAITVLGTAEDPRQLLVRDAVAFWNSTLAELGSGFRLGAITRRQDAIEDAVVARLSQNVLSGATAPFPPELGPIPGDIVVVLSNAEFISFIEALARGQGPRCDQKRGRPAHDPSQCRTQRDRA